MVKASDILASAVVPGVAVGGKGSRDFLLGTKDKIKQQSTLSSQQEELMRLITEGLKSGEGAFKDLFGSFDKAAFEEGIAQPALKHFQDTILPQIQERFVAGNQVLGSGLRRGQLKAGQDLQAQLAALMYEAQQKQQQNRLGGIQSALGTKAVENLYQQGQTGAVPSFLQGLGKGIGSAAGAAIAG